MRKDWSTVKAPSKLWLWSAKLIAAGNLLMRDAIACTAGQHRLRGGFLLTWA
jgi:hypothetical protein